MPCHPDRVRRNYHKIEIYEKDDIKNMELIITTRITKLQLATMISAREAINMIKHKYFKDLTAILKP